MKCYNRACGTDMILFGRKVPLTNIIPPEMIMAWEDSTVDFGVGVVCGDEVELDKTYLISICPECGFVMMGIYKTEVESDRDLKGIIMVNLDGVEEQYLHEEEEYHYDDGYEEEQERAKFEHEEDLRMEYEHSVGPEGEEYE